MTTKQKNFYKALAIAGAIILIVMAFASIVQAKELEIPVEAQEASEQDCELNIKFTNNKILVWKEEFLFTATGSDFGSVLELTLQPTGSSWSISGTYGSGTSVPRGTKVPFEPIVIHSWESTCQGTSPKMTAQVNYLRSSLKAFEVDSSKGMRGLFTIPFKSGSLVTTEGAGISSVNIVVTGLK